MKILVVDDEIVSRKKMENILDDFGECYIVESGTEAITAFNEAWSLGMPFDLVLLDISMPDISGIEVLNRIRQTEKDKSLAKSHCVKVMMVTSHSDKDLVVDCMKAGCNNYIVKPFDRERVLNKLSSIGYAFD
ncbi:MAG: response regulator [Proteobacteria bacterium]|nr:response regulator [Pseudomonadota bacterium]